LWFSEDVNLMECCLICWPIVLQFALTSTPQLCLCNTWRCVSLFPWWYDADSASSVWYTAWSSNSRECTYQLKFVTFRLWKGKHGIFLLTLPHTSFDFTHYCSWFLGCVKCKRCKLLLPMSVCLCLSVYLSVTQLNSGFTVRESFGAAFAKSLWSLVQFETEFAKIVLSYFSCEFVSLMIDLWTLK